MNPAKTTSLKSDPNDYIILWMQNISPTTGSIHAMLPVSSVADDLMQNVWSSTEHCSRQRFDTYEEAVRVCKHIQNTYGFDQTLIIVPDNSQWSDEKTRDRFLPHWAWETKYGPKKS